MALDSARARDVMMTRARVRSNALSFAFNSGPLLSPALATSAFSAAAPLRVAVVGAGPAGLYAADRLLHRFRDAVRVDVLERLPAPLGLVRYGVAPDHGATSAPVAARFGRLLADERVRLLCNACVADAPSAAPAAALPLPLSALQARYHAVVLATGAQRARTLGVPGEALPGVLTAAAFVSWYTGHPGGSLHAPPPPPQLRAGPHAVVVGAGNVALDCARLLLRPAQPLLAASDAPAAVVAALAASTVRHVTLLVRRSAAQLACTPRELRELLALPGLRLHTDPGLGLAEADEAELRADGPAARARRRCVEELRAALARREAAPPEAADADERSLSFLFLRSPTAFLPGPAGRVGAVQLGAEALEGPPGSRRLARPPPAADPPLPPLPAQLVLISAGAFGAPLEGVPFDSNRGTVPHARGAVLDGSAAIPGLFCVGWLKRGPKGIIGSNLECAEETVAAVAEAAAEGRLPQPPLPPIDPGQLLRDAGGGRLLSAAGWGALDAAERAAGAAKGRPREKAATLAEMLRFADLTA